MQPKNYCRDIRRQALSVLELPRPTDEQRFKATSSLDMLSRAQKFLLPEGGVLLEDWEFRALGPNDEVRMPHEYTALEFDHHRHKIVICVRDFAEASVLVSSMYFQCADGTWTNRSSVFSKRPEKLFHDIGKRERLPIAYSVKNWPNYAINGAEETTLLEAYVAKVVVSFANALACANVIAEAMPARKLPSKSKKAALPFDTYHVLMVECDPLPTTRCSDSSRPLSTRRPREHLRRGCVVRESVNGRRAHWRNATVVNAGKGGKVTKDYALTARSTASTPARHP